MFVCIFLLRNTAIITNVTNLLKVIRSDFSNTLENFIFISIYNHLFPFFGHTNNSEKTFEHDKTTITRKSDYMNTHVVSLKSRLL